MFVDVLRVGFCFLAVVVAAVVVAVVAAVEENLKPLSSPQWSLDLLKRDRFGCSFCFLVVFFCFCFFFSIFVCVFMFFVFVVFLILSCF